MKLITRIQLATDDLQPFMGRGLVELLRNIQTLRSIHQAAQHMKLSYVKALSILKRLETQAGRPMVNRYKGGCQRGGAELTDFGAAFLKEFAELQRQVQQFADRRLCDFSHKLQGLITEKETT